MIYVLINSFVFHAYLKDSPMAGIQEHHSGVELDCSFWFPIVSSLSEFVCQSRHGPDAICPLQTGRPPFPIGTPIHFDSAKWWVRCEMPCPRQLLTEYLPLLHLAPAPWLQSCSILFKGDCIRRKRTSLGPNWSELRTISLLPQAFWNIYFAPFFKIKFYFKLVYKGVVCYCNSVSRKCAQNSPLPCIQQCICISEDFTQLLKILYVPNCLQLPQ